MLNDLYSEAAKICSPIAGKEIVSFVDVFGGSGQVIYNLPKEWNIQNKVYNDLDHNLYNTMCALRNDEEREKIIKDFEIVPSSREFFNSLKEKEKNNESLTPFEYLYATANSFNSERKTFSTFISGKNEKYNRIINTALGAWNEIRTWTIENLDFRKLLKMYDSEHTYFYLDPPYLTGGKHYKLNFSEQDFIDMFEILSKSKAYWLMNESEVDFDFIVSIFGQPKYVKEYRNKFMSRAKIANGTATSFRKEGYWTNY